MESNLTGKSRREKRKEARLARKENKHQSWVQHQETRKMKKTQLRAKVDSRDGARVLSSDQATNLQNIPGSDKDVNLDQQSDMQKNDEIEVGSSISNGSVKLKKRKQKGFDMHMKDEVQIDSLMGNVSAKSKKRSLKKQAKRTNFDEHLQNDMWSMDRLAQEDLKLERMLAKKLKVKNGKLGGVDDGMNLLVKGIPSVLEMEEDDLVRSKRKSLKKKSKTQGSLEHLSSETQGEPSSMQLEDIPSTPPAKKCKKDESKSVASESEEMTEDAQNLPVKVPPSESAVKYVPPNLRSHTGSESQDLVHLRRRVRGLLNKLSESNVESITTEMATIYHTVVRSVGSQIINEEVLASCSRGPRGNEQYASVFAAFAAGMACLVGIDFSARLMASLAKCFEEEYLKEDNLSLRNLTLLLSYLCMFGVFSSDLIYDFLITLSKRLVEIDVSTILTILQCCGMKIRGDDPTAMKNFILSVQEKVNELKASPGDGSKDINSKRMEFMLETIYDIKNNKKRMKEDPVSHTRIKKWLQKLGVESILLKGIKWSKLLDPDKKGQWWQSGDMASREEAIAEVASTIDKDVLEAQKLLQLASAQRMNTEARKAIFCIIMSADDYIDASMKLRELALPGEQDREIIRVLVECCLQEKVFNKYYTVLASRLCEDEKNHKITLQYCLWDHFKELNSMPLLRSMNLAKFVAEMLSSFVLSLSVLKIVDFVDVKQLTAGRIMHFRILFEALLQYSDKIIWNICTRIAAVPELEALRHGIKFFVKEYVIPNSKDLASKFKIVKKALDNIEGILM